MASSLSRPGARTISTRNLAYLDEHIQQYISSGRPAGALTVVYHKGQRLGHARPLDTVANGLLRRKEQP